MGCKEQITSRTSEVGGGDVKKGQEWVEKGGGFVVT